MYEKDIWEIIGRSFTEPLNAEERALLEDWLRESENNARIYDDINRLHVKFTLPVSASATRREIRSRFEHDLFIQPRVKRIRQVVLWSWAVAATVLLLVASGIFLTGLNPGGKSSGMVVSEPGKKNIAEVVLPDGSRVWLNSGSQLVYPGKFSWRSREVFLTGEAFFQVQKNHRPFIVNTGDVKVRVYGTRFNISSYTDDNYIQVTLISGSVSVQAKDKEPLLLTPGYQATFSRNTGALSVSKVETEPYEAWKEGMMIFRSRRFDEMARTLERVYNVKIIVRYEPLKNEIYTGRFSREESIQKILNIIRTSTPFHYRIENGVIDIFK